MDKEQDHYTRIGASALAASINRYWRKRGHSNVNAYVVPIRGLDAPYFTVASNLVNGMPPKTRR